MNKQDSNDKITEIASSIGMSAATTSLLSLMFGIINTPYNFAFLTGGTVITTPFMYLGMKKLKNKIDDRFNRDMHHAGQISIMLKETLEYDRRIESMTAQFLQEILDVFETENKDFPQNELMKISQFLYLINCNYYEKINKRIPTMTREQLVKRLINQISYYLNETKRDTFNEKDAQKVLNNCFYISEDIRKEIVKEFKKSKVKFAGKIDYEIVRNDTTGGIDQYIAKKVEETKNLYPEFNIDNITHYQHIIETVKRSKVFEKMDIGNPENMSYDIEFLMIAMQTIAHNQREKLLAINGFSNFWMVTDFIYSSITYSLVNNKTKVGKDEIIKTFKNWDYIPFDIKLNALNELFESERIDYSYHPFKTSKQKNIKTYQKIIDFSPRKKETDD